MILKVKKAFTLIEVIVSISILGIIFTFLFQTTNSTKKLNQNYLDKGTQTIKEAKILKIFMHDFTQVIGVASVIYGKKYDIVRLKTKHSVYGIIEPFVTYYVSKKNLALIRTESLTKYDLYKKEDIYKEYILGDIIAKDSKSFKVFFQNNYFNILFRTKHLKPIVLKLPKVE